MWKGFKWKSVQLAIKLGEDTQGFERYTIGRVIYAGVPHPW